MRDYAPPVDQLLKIGNDFRPLDDDWHDYLGLGLGPKHVPDLTRMAVDEDLDFSDSNSNQGFAPMHAWRALGVLRAEAAVPTLVGILEGQDPDDFNDWVTEEMPIVFGMIGPSAIPELTRLLENDDAGNYPREDAANGLIEIARRHPEERSGIVATITRLLERAEWHDRSFNGFIVSNLLDLEAKESADVIEQAYAGKFVDDSIQGTWYDVWHALKLEGEPPPKTERLDRIGPFRPLQGDLGSSALFTNPSSWKPTELKTRVERKERNKARQKLEKKVKGKKGKGR